MQIKIRLGSVYRDKMHGIQGIATARTEYLTGCDRVALETVKDGEIKTHYFDVSMVEFVKDIDAIAHATPADGDPGGPAAVPPSRDVGPRR